MIYVLAAMLVLVAVTALWLLRQFVEADPAKLARGLRQFLLALGLLISGTTVIIGLISERVLVVLAGVGALGAMWLGASRWSRRARQAAKAASAVATDYLDLRSDQWTGTMSGAVRRGRFQGRALADLSRPELLILWQECRNADERGARLLESYLDHLAPGWRQESGEEGGAAVAATMTRADAYAVLGLEPGASDSDIEEAYRRLMRKLDPRHGGSTYLAGQINQARKLLLRR
jgi:DnaJ-domain-containing protein 1